MNNKIIPLKVSAGFFYERAIRCMDKMDYDGGIKYFRRAIEHDPSNASNHCNLAGVLSETGNYKESNKVLFNVMKKIDPQAVYCYYYIANNYANLGDFERAAVYANKYITADPDGEYAEDAEDMLAFLDAIITNDAQLEYANMLLEEGKFAEAVKEFLTYLKDNPDDYAAKNNLALTYFYQGDFDKAIKETNKIIDEQPHNIHAKCNLAIFYLQSEQHLKAANVIRYLEKITPVKEEHVYKLALTLGMFGKHEIAYKHLKRILKNKQLADYQVIYMTAVAAFNTGRLTEALRLWRKTNSIDPESEVTKFYIELVEQAIKSGEKQEDVGYYYNLPFEEHLRQIDSKLHKGKLTTNIFSDPVVKLSLFWALKHSDEKTKLNVIRLLGVVFDDEVKVEFEKFLLNPNDDDELKKVILILFHQVGIQGPYTVFLKKQKTELSMAEVAKMYIAWKPEWLQVIELVIDSIVKHEQQNSTIFIADSEAIWIEFLSNNANKMPAKFNPNSWAAALEYAVYKLHNQKITQKEVADRYQISISTLADKYKQLDW